MKYTEDDLKEDLKNQEYEFGFTTDVESEKIPKGLNEDIIRLISAKKNEPEWLLDFRLKSFEIWKNMEEPNWAHVNYEKPDFQDIIYYSSPSKEEKNWEDVDPEICPSYHSLKAELREPLSLEREDLEDALDITNLQCISVISLFNPNAFMLY